MLSAVCDGLTARSLILKEKLHFDLMGVFAGTMPFNPGLTIENIMREAYLQLPRQVRLVTGEALPEEPQLWRDLFAPPNIAYLAGLKESFKEAHPSPYTVQQNEKFADYVLRQTISRFLDNGVFECYNDCEKANICYLSSQNAKNPCYTIISLIKNLFWDFNLILLEQKTLESHAVTISPLIKDEIKGFRQDIAVYFNKVSFSEFDEAKTNEELGGEADLPVISISASFFIPLVFGCVIQPLGLKIEVYSPEMARRLPAIKLSIMTGSLTQKHAEFLREMEMQAKLQRSI